MELAFKLILIYVLMIAAVMIGGTLLICPAPDGSGLLPFIGSAIGIIYLMQRWFRDEPLAPQPRFVGKVNYFWGICRFDQTGKLISVVNYPYGTVDCRQIQNCDPPPPEAVMRINVVK